MVQVLRVQTGVTTLPAGQASIDAILLNQLRVDPSNPTRIAPYAFLTFSIDNSAPNTNPAIGMITGQISSKTGLHFERGTGIGAPEVNIRWWVTEFMTGVYVYRGSTAYTTTVQDVNLGFNLLANTAFPLHTYRTPYGILDSNDYISAELLPTTDQIRFTTGKTPDVGAQVEWQVITFTDGTTTVDSQAGSMSASEMTKTITMSGSAIASASSFYVTTYYLTSDPVTLDESFVVGRFSTTTDYQLIREDVGTVVQSFVYRIRFSLSEDSKVQHSLSSPFLYPTIPATYSVTATYPAPIDELRTMILGGGLYGIFGRATVTNNRLDGFVAQDSLGPTPTLRTISRAVATTEWHGEGQTISFNRPTIAPASALLSITPRQAPATALVRLTTFRSAPAKALVKKQYALSASAATLVTGRYTITSAATAVVSHTYRLTTGWTLTLTQGTFKTQAAATAKVMGTFKASAPASTILTGPSSVGIAKAAYSQDPTRQVFNITNNAKFDALGTGLWLYQINGTASRVEIGLDGNIRTFTASSGVRNGVITWSALNAGGAGDFVRRTGDEMTGTLAFAPASPLGSERWEYRYSDVDSDFIIDQYDNLNNKTQVLKVSVASMTYKGSVIVFNNGSGNKNIDFSTGVMTVNGGDVGLGSSTAVYQANGIRFGPNAALTASPGIWNSANTANTNYALVAHVDYTTVNAKTAGEVRLGIGGTTVATVNTNGLVLASSTRLYAPGAASTYGSLSVDGSKASYAGINFRTGATNYGTFMVDTAGAIQGFYNAADNAWLWYWSSGTLTAGTVPVARISGLANSATITADTANTASQIVQRDSNGTILVGRVYANNTVGSGANANEFINDLWTYRAANSGTGVLYLNLNQNRYLFYDGSTYVMPNSNLVLNGTTVTSSRTIKKYIKPLANAWELLSRVSLKSYFMKDPTDTRQHYGVIWEELVETLPELTLQSSGPHGEEFKSVDYNSIFALAVRVVQEQQAQIEEMRVAIRKLEAQAQNATKE